MELFYVTWDLGARNKKGKMAGVKCCVPGSENVGYV